MTLQSATAAEFQQAAWRNARTFCLWTINAVLLGWLTSAWWASLPGALALWAAYGFVACTLKARKLRTPA